MISVTRASLSAEQALLGLLHLRLPEDRKSTRLNSSHGYISYAVFCLKKKKTKEFSPRSGQIAWRVACLHSPVPVFCSSYATQCPVSRVPSQQQGPLARAPDDHTSTA